MVVYESSLKFKQWYLWVSTFVWARDLEGRCICSKNIVQRKCIWFSYRNTKLLWNFNFNFNILPHTGVILNDIWCSFVFWIGSSTTTSGYFTLYSLGLSSSTLVKGPQTTSLTFNIEQSYSNDQQRRCRITVYQDLSKILEEEANLDFASIMVQTMVVWPKCIYREQLPLMNYSSDGNNMARLRSDAKHCFLILGNKILGELYCRVHSGIVVHLASIANIAKQISLACNLATGTANRTSLSLGKQLHSVMITLGCVSNVFCGSSLLDMYAKCGYIKEAIQVFKEMPSRNIVSWNAIISAYAQEGDGEATLRTFEEMIEIV